MTIEIQVFKNNLLNIQQASQWESHFPGRVITASNISYLVQYWKLDRF